MNRGNGKRVPTLLALLTCAMMTAPGSTAAASFDRALLSASGHGRLCTVGNERGGSATSGPHRVLGGYVHHGEEAARSSGPSSVDTDVAAESVATPQVSTADAGGPIPVYVHVIRDDAGNGNVTDPQIAAQIQVLNDSFGVWGWSFVLADTERTNDSSWYTMSAGSQAEKRAKTALRRGSADDLNLYTASPGGAVLGFASYPWNYAKRPSIDGVVVLNGTLPGGNATPYDLGDSAVHETGHWLGLYHTFEGGCRDRDLVSDTPAERSPAFGCPFAQDSCAKERGLDSVHNFMNMANDACMFEFTPGQADRMAVMWASYRNGK